MSVRKPDPLQLTSFVPWAAAHFQTEEIRDRFLHAAAALPACDVEVEPMRDEVRGALVRWTIRLESRAMLVMTVSR